jgi:hypothetical protein
MRTVALKKVAGLFAAAALLLAAASVSAKPCGDDVHGRDIPCACGDTVVSNLVLIDDPVTTARCVHNGLIIAAGHTAARVEIDLNGRQLRGSGKGSGLWVTSGGSAGARIVSHSGPAVIEGFRDGIIGRTRGTVALIDNVILSANARDGIQVFSDDVQIRGCEARASGRDGISVRGKGWLLKDVRAVDSRRFGINANGIAGSVGVRRAGVVAESSGRAGINVMGTSHRVIDCVAMGGRGDGLATAGEQHEITGCLLLDNAGNGANGTSSFDRVQDNRAERNGKNGILFRGQGAQDAGGNIGLDNGAALDPQPGKQCEIGGVACR